MRKRIQQVVRRAKFAAFGGAVGGAVGGLVGRNAASTGAGVGAMIGATLAEKIAPADSLRARLKRDTTPDAE
jgi:outer membrane lipoprotein SlyB